MNKTGFGQWAKATLASLATLLALSSPAAAGIVVYDQPSDFPGGGLFASQNDPGGLGAVATIYDNFTLLSTTLITDAHWQGGYFNPEEQGTITAFTIGFWSDVGGQPGLPLLTQTIPGNAGETFVGSSSGLVFDYNTDLLTPFLASAGVTYWLSIVPTTTFPPQWGWHTGTGGDGVGFQDFFGSRSPTETDFAFALTTPEPASLALLGAGLLGAGALGWYRRRRS